jgi:ketosteroid isomerase-like protein
MCGRKLMLVAVASGVLAAGCAKPAPEAPAAPAVDLAAEELAVRERSMEWLKLATAKDPAAIASGILASNVVTMYDGVINEGATAFLATSAANLAARPDSTITWTTDEVHVAASGDLAYELGTATEDADGDGKAAPTSGRYVTVWTKADGTWRAVVDAGTQRKPAEADAKSEDKAKAKAPAGG